MIFDTHAHYDDAAFDEGREELIAALPAGGIGTVVNVGASLESTKTTLELARRYPYFYGAAGVHPNETGELTERDMEWLKGICREPKIVAVGEIGLDYHWDEPERGVQKKWFVRQLELAREVKLPVIIHSREAAKDTLDLMKGERAEEIGGGRIRVRQGDMVLTAGLLEQSACRLQAPETGAMTRTIRENVSCRARYCLKKGGRTLLGLETPSASFEYEYP